MKSKIFILIALTAILTSCAGKAKQKQIENMNTDTTAVAQADSTDVLSTVPETAPVFEIVTSMGSIIIELFDDTPIHRDNFKKLVNEQFFDGILFHRVINGFMIQAGDPSTKDSTANRNSFGIAEAGYTLPAEIRPEHKHLKGALAAARKGDFVNPMKESSGSQFYIVQSEEGCAHLDGEYTVFGQTIDGFDVIDKIARVRTDGNNVPLNEVRIIKIVSLQ